MTLTRATPHARELNYFELNGHVSGLYTNLSWRFNVLGFSYFFHACTKQRGG